MKRNSASPRSRCMVMQKARQAPTIRNRRGQRASESDAAPQGCRRPVCRISRTARGTIQITARRIRRPTLSSATAAAPFWTRFWSLSVTDVSIVSPYSPRPAAARNPHNETAMITMRITRNAEWPATGPVNQSGAGSPRTRRKRPTTPPVVCAFSGSGCTATRTPSGTRWSGGQVADREDPPGGCAQTCERDRLARLSRRGLRVVNAKCLSPPNTLDRVTSTKAPAESPRSLLREHLGLVVSGLGAFFVVSRLWAFSGWDVQTALIVLDTQGTSAVILGSLIPFLCLAPLLAALMVYLAARESACNGEPKPWWMFLAGVLIVVALAISPFVLTLAAVASVAIRPVLRWLGRGVIWLLEHVPWPTGWAPKPVPEQVPLPTVAVINIGVVFGVLALLPFAWLPAENIQHEGQRGFTGFVLREDDDTLLVLRSEPRGVVRVATTGTARTYCQPGEDASLSLPVGWSLDLVQPPIGWIFFDTGEYPGCIHSRGLDASA